jgi:hypothetical protein
VQRLNVVTGIRIEMLVVDADYGHAAKRRILRDERAELTIFEEVVSSKR